MTSNQIALWAHQENVRHNQAYERETARHNRKTEEQGDLNFLETVNQNRWTRDNARNQLQYQYDRLATEQSIAGANLRYNYDKLSQDYDLAYANYANQRSIASMNNANQYAIAQMNNETSRRNADISAATSRYVADRNAQTSITTTQMRNNTDRLINMTQIRNKGLWEYNSNQLKKELAELDANNNRSIAVLNNSVRERIADADRKTKVDVINAQLNKDYNIAEYNEKTEGSRRWISIITDLFK
jgi:hypothetical protein